MNSSIFISDPAGERSPWRRLLALYAATFVSIGLVTAGLILALDPYDTGRFALFGGYGVPHFGPRLRLASVARQPELDVAIIGNSTIQLIDPARIGALSGKRVVTLAVSGTGPVEQEAILTWLLDHHRHRGLRAVVFGIDDSWCRHDGKLAPHYAFPFWLYSSDPIVYAANMIRLKSFEAAERKIKLMLQLAPPARSDGYDDYDAGRVWDPAGAMEGLKEDVETEPVAAVADINFAALQLLETILARVPREIALVFVVPPRYRGALLKHRADPERAQACMEELARLAAQRQRTQVLDFSRRSDLVERAEDYWDRLHYRAPVARKLEAEIAGALADENR